jgi:hypothetical protein
MVAYYTHWRGDARINSRAGALVLTSKLVRPSAHALISCVSRISVLKIARESFFFNVFMLNHVANGKAKNARDELKLLNKWIGTNG